MTECRSQSLSSHYPLDSKTWPFSHYEIAKEFGFQPTINGKQVKNLRPTLFYSVITPFCEANNGKSDCSVSEKTEQVKQLGARETTDS